MSAAFESPSRFWEQLSSEHERDLRAFGPEGFKRHQALRYFTWRWSWRTLSSSEQFRFLLRHSDRRTLASCAAERVDLSDRAWTGVDWPKRDRWLYVFAVRLLWEYAQRHDSLGTTQLSEPEVGNPLPVWRRGRRISQDLANTALEVNAIIRGLGGRAPSSIVEVGAGYGRVAHALLTLFPSSTYTVVDIEPARTIAAWYLSQLFPSNRLRFLSPAEADDVPGASASLALSISSLQEMTPAQVEQYLEFMDRVAAGGTVYLKQWERWRNPADGVTLEFDTYPIPPRWRPLFGEQAPVQTAFRQAAWSVPGIGEDKA